MFENDGSTSHAPGGVVALSHSKLLTQMAQYSSDLYRGLAPFSADRNTYNAVGGLEIAVSPRRFQDLRRLHAEGKSFGAESHLLTPAETGDRLPLLDERRITGSLFVPKSAIIAGAHTAAALAREAERMGGVRFIAHAEVTAWIARGLVVAIALVGALAGEVFAGATGWENVACAVAACAVFVADVRLSGPAASWAGA